MRLSAAAALLLAIADAASAQPAAPAPVPLTTAPAAAGGGPGQVWINTRSRVYHCQGDRNYGHAARGAYMTEQAARAAGNRSDHGKACAL